MNEVKITVKIVESCGVVAEYGSEKIYSMTCVSPRISGVEDKVIVNYSSELSDELKEGFVEITGTIRRKSSTTYIFAQSIEVLSEEPSVYTNEIHIIGEVAKPPRFRKTTKSELSITDVCVKVMRNSVKYDIIMCLAWNKYAHIAKDLKVGDKVELNGRVQSRTFENGDTITEVSCMNIEKVEE